MERLLDRKRGTLMAATGLAIALLLLGSVVGVFVVEPEADGAGAAPGARALQEDTTPVQPPIALEPLITPAPPGFDQIKPPIDGPVTVAQLAEGRGDKEGALRLFEQLGLQNGFTRSWQRVGADDLLALRIYQFGKPSGAARYTEQSVQARTSSTSKPFDVPGVPGAVGIEVGVDDKNRHLAFVFAPKGRLVTVIAASFAQPPDRNVLNALARSQSQLLP